MVKKLIMLNNWYLILPVLFFYVSKPAVGQIVRSPDLNTSYLKASILRGPGFVYELELSQIKKAAWRSYANVPIEFGVFDGVGVKFLFSPSIGTSFRKYFGKVKEGNEFTGFFIEPVVKFKLSTFFKDQSKQRVENLPILIIQYNSLGLGPGYKFKISNKWYGYFGIYGRYQYSFYFPEDNKFAFRADFSINYRIKTIQKKRRGKL